MKPEQRDAEYERIRSEYMKTLEDAEEKVKLANEIYELVEKYLKRLDQELQKFKIELEADNAGITEILERSMPFSLISKLNKMAHWHIFHITSSLLSLSTLHFSCIYILYTSIFQKLSCIILAFEMKSANNLYICKQGL